VGWQGKNELTPFSWQGKNELTPVFKRRKG
jgi:hypothetical protein